MDAVIEHADIVPLLPNDNNALEEMPLISLGSNHDATEEEGEEEIKETMLEAIARVRVTHQEKLLVNAEAESNGNAEPDNYWDLIISSLSTYKPLLSSMLTGSESATDYPFYYDILLLVPLLEEMKKAIKEFNAAYVIWSPKRLLSIAASEGADFDTLHDLQHKVDATKVAMGVTGVVAGGVAIAGMALAPFTLGLSLALMIPGLAVGIAAGGVSGVASIIQHKKEKPKVEYYQNIFDEDFSFSKGMQPKIKALSRLSKQIVELVKKNEKYHKEFTELLSPHFKLLGFKLESHGSSLSFIPGTLGFIALADTLLVVGNVAKIAARSLGIAFTGVCVVVDVVQIALASKSIHEGSQNDAELYFEKVMKAMKDEHANLAELYNKTRE